MWLCNVRVAFRSTEDETYLTVILTVFAIGILPFNVTVTLTAHVPFFKVLIAVPKTLQIFFEDTATLSAYFEPVGAFSLACVSSFDFGATSPTFTE